jgi:hypothetical protein
MSKNDTPHKCQEILLKIVEICNKTDWLDTGEYPSVGFAKDWGNNSLTVSLPETHYHVGSPDKDYTFEQLINHLHKVLMNKYEND